MLEITLESKSIHKSEKGLEHNDTFDNGDKAQKDDFKDTSGIFDANGKSLLFKKASVERDNGSEAKFI